MLVDVNLLPRKTKKKSKPILIFSILFILALILGGLMYWQYTVKQDQLQSLEKEILQVQDTTALMENQLQHTNTMNSGEQLQQVISWAETYPIDTVLVLKHLIGLLPERGYFQQFTYNEEGTIQLSIRFDTSREAADYLTELTRSKYLSSATLTSITAAKINEQTDAETETGTDTETKVVEGQYLPRYVGMYEVKLNDAALKEAAGQETGTGKGVGDQ